KNNKRTLATRFGEGFIRKIIALALFAPYLLGIAWWQETRLATLLPFVALPLGIKIWQGIASTPPSKALNAFLGKASLHLLIFGVLLSVALLWK
ncbi:MAG: 1,4-dihydroxy-2-naphthoate octaprenyltransferase, partial [Bacteriovoracia bacterium]